MSQISTAGVSCSQSLAGSAVHHLLATLVIHSRQRCQQRPAEVIIHNIGLPKIVHDEDATLLCVSASSHLIPMHSSCHPPLFSLHARAESVR